MWLFRKSNRPSKAEKEAGEIVISSSFPYNVGVVEEEDDIYYKTFTEEWCYKTEHETRLPVKMMYSLTSLMQLVLYLPARDAIKTLKKLTDDDKAIMDLWIFLDDGNFFIVFPDSCDLAIDEDEQLASFTISLSKVGFHSEKEDLRKIYTPEETCKFVIEELLQHEILEIQQKILTNNETIEFEPIEVLSSTIEPLQEGINAIVKKYNDTVGSNGE